MNAQSLLQMFDANALRATAPMLALALGLVLVLLAGVFPLGRAVRSALVVAALVAGGLRLLFTRTRLGIAMRAVVDDRSLLQLNGGRPGRTAMLSWGLGAALAAKPDQCRGVISWLEGLNSVAMTIIGWAMALAPLAKRAFPPAPCRD